MLGKFFREYLFKLVVGLAVTGTVTVFAILNKYWGWPNAVVGGVLLLDGVLYLMDRLGIGPSLKSRVRDWLDSSGYNVRTIDDSNEFHFVMTDNVGTYTSVIRKASDSPILIVSPQHKATAEQLATFKAMPESERQKFWKAVRLELLHYRIPFSDLDLEGQGVEFSESIMPSAGLTVTEFLSRVLFVRSGARLYHELLADLNPINHTVSTLGTESAPPLQSSPPTTVTASSSS